MNKEGNAIIISIMTLLFVIIVMFSIIAIYINKFYSIKRLNDYYDKNIVLQLKINNSK